MKTPSKTLPAPLRGGWAQAGGRDTTQALTILLPQAPPMWAYQTSKRASSSQVLWVLPVIHPIHITSRCLIWVLTILKIKTEKI